VSFERGYWFRKVRFFLYLVQNMPINYSVTKVATKGVKTGARSPVPIIIRQNK